MIIFASASRSFGVYTGCRNDGEKEDEDKDEEDEDMSSGAAPAAPAAKAAGNVAPLPV